MNDDIFRLIGAGSTISLVILCFNLVKANGHKLNEFIKRSECHQAQGNMTGKITDLKDHIDTRIDDLKDYIDKNGGRK